MMNFKNYLHIVEQNTVGTHNDFATGAYLPSSFTGTETGMALPSLDLIQIPNQIPTITKIAKVSYIELNKNPIDVRLDDGTKLNFSRAEFERNFKSLHGLKENQKLKVVFQQNQTNPLNIMPKIVSITLMN